MIDATFSTISLSFEFNAAFINSLCTHSWLYLKIEAPSLPDEQSHPLRSAITKKQHTQQVMILL